MSIFSSTSTASTGNSPTFIANIRLVCARTSSGFLAKATPPIPARPVVQAWILNRQLRCPVPSQPRPLRRQSMRPWPRGNFESIRRKNGFTLILVKSRHGCVLFRMKTPKVQPSCGARLRRGKRSTLTASATRRRIQTYVPGERTVRFGCHRGPFISVCHFWCGAQKRHNPSRKLLEYHR